MSDDHQIPSIRRVSVDLDPDDGDRRTRALDWVRGFATRLGVPLVAWISASRDSAERSTADENMFAAQALESTRHWLIHHGGDVDEIQVAPVDVDAALLASTVRGDVVVLGVEVTEGFSGWALGSRCHELAHSLQCPLVVVPPGASAPDDAPIVVGVDGNDPNTAIVDWSKHLADDLHRTLLPVFAYNAIRVGGFGDLHEFGSFAWRPAADVSRARKCPHPDAWSSAKALGMPV